MTENEINKAIYDKYITPTNRRKNTYIGIEIEMPVVNLNKQAVDENIVFEMTSAFRKKFGFSVVSYDDNGIANSMADEKTGDDLSFDCSYSNLELSLGKGRSLFEIKERFEKYYNFINEKLSENNYTLTGMGINPYYNINHNKPVPNERYRMLYHHLHTYKKYESSDRSFHSFPQFGTFTSASQVQLDVEKENIADIINISGRLEPYKAMLFSNSYFPETPEFLCARNMLWEKSMQGYNPHNIGMFEYEIKDNDDLVEYIKSTSIYCTMRNGKYINFTPVTIYEYLTSDKIHGEYYDGEKYTETDITPDISDLEYLRTFKFEDLTYRGTIEFRSVCCQPVKDVMTVSAFHLGFIENIDKFRELLYNDRVIYSHGYTPAELQRMYSMNEIPKFADKSKLSNQLIKIVQLAEEGLKKREKGEETFIMPLYERARRLTNPARIFRDGLENGIPVEHFISEYARI
jgi:gamma-glutamylcysteine synthetase